MAAGLWGCSPHCGRSDLPIYLVTPSSNSARVAPGTASTITDLWVYSSTDVVGVFPLPAVVPLIGEDLQREDVVARHSKMDSVTAVPCPFYTTVDVIPAVAPGMRDTLLPEVGLVDSVRYLPIEDFETSNVFGSMVGNGLDSDSTEGRCSRRTVAGWCHGDEPSSVFEPWSRSMT